MLTKWLYKAVFRGACDGIRTCDLRITNALHYQLCYTSIFYCNKLKNMLQ